MYFIPERKHKRLKKKRKIQSFPETNQLEK